MIDLYALTSPNVQKIYIMLEETKLPYKEHFIDVWKGEQYNPDFIKINPNSKIPAIVDHDGPGGKPYTVVESGAILMYLAEKTGKFLPKDMAKKYDVLQWLLFQTSNIGPNFGQFTHFKLFAPKDKDHSYSMTRHQTEVKRLYEVLEKRLAQVALSRRRRIFDRRHRHLPVDAQSRRPGREVGRQSEPGALVQVDRRTAGGESRARQGRADQIEPRHRQRRSERPLLQSRQIREGVVFPPRDSGEGDHP